VSGAFSAYHAERLNIESAALPNESLSVIIDSVDLMAADTGSHSSTLGLLQDAAERIKARKCKCHSFCHPFLYLIYYSPQSTRPLSHERITPPCPPSSSILLAIAHSYSTISPLNSSPSTQDISAPTPACFRHGQVLLSLHPLRPAREEGDRIATLRGSTGCYDQYG
jgi:hypothetical protein